METSASFEARSAPSSYPTIALVGGADACPLHARAQQTTMPAIGFLHQASPDTYPDVMVAFREGLKETGFVEGQNVAIEYR